jgi:hypothetical protein
MVPCNGGHPTCVSLLRADTRRAWFPWLREEAPRPQNHRIARRGQADRGFLYQNPSKSHRMLFAGFQETYALLSAVWQPLTVRG